MPDFWDGFFDFFDGVIDSFEEASNGAGDTLVSALDMTTTGIEEDSEAVGQAIDDSLGEKSGTPPASDPNPLARPSAPL